MTGICVVPENGAARYPSVMNNFNYYHLCSTYYYGSD
jgi:hypothetical protein